MFYKWPNLLNFGAFGHFEYELLKEKSRRDGEEKAVSWKWLSTVDIFLKLMNRACPAAAFLTSIASAPEVAKEESREDREGSKARRFDLIWEPRMDTEEHECKVRLKWLARRVDLISDPPSPSGYGRTSC